MSQTVFRGESAQLSVEATGTAPLSYQWFKDGVPLDGATSASLSLAQVGIGDAGRYSVRVSNALGRVASDASENILAAGFLHSAFVKQDGSAWAMGSNAEGVLGDGTGLKRFSPVLVGSDIVQVSAGPYHKLLLTSDGRAFATGRNVQGQLGDGTTTNRSTPVEVMSGVKSISAGAFHSLFVTTNNELWGAGNNSWGQLDATVGTGWRPRPERIATGVTAAAAGDTHTLFLKTDGSLWAMGSNGLGELGDGTETDRLSPVQVATGVRAVDAAAVRTLFLKEDNTLWMAGLVRDLNQVDPPLIKHAIPVLVARDVVGFSAGDYHDLFVKSDGSLWARGSNNYGQLGDGTTISAMDPIQVATDVVAAAAGNYQSLFARSNGELWVMGSNLNGECGLGQTGFDPVAQTKLTEGLPHAAQLAVAERPSISAQPASITRTAPAAAEFTVTVAHPTPTTSYAWQRLPAGSSQWENLRASDIYRGVDTVSLAISPSSTGMTGDQFRCIIETGAGGTFTTQSATLTVEPGPGAPRFTLQPAALATLAGSEVILSVAASGDSVVYQWYLDGQPIAGATSATLTLGGIQVSHAGLYHVVASSAAASSDSNRARVDVQPPPASDARLLNLSARALCRSGEGVVIPGFVIAGTGSKRLLLRAVGPTLEDFGVSDFLPDPRMIVKRRIAGAWVDQAENDNWHTNANAGEIVLTAKNIGAFALDAASNDAALLMDLPAGEYTVVASGGAAGYGTTLVELYEAESDPAACRLVNISNRGYVGDGNAIMIPGFVVSSEGARTFLIRAVGPELARRYGITDVLENPELTVVRRTAKSTDIPVVANDDWSADAGAAQTASVSQAVGAFSLPANSKDAALVVTLAPGTYTVIVRGVSGSTGTALAEIYLVP